MKYKPYKFWSRNDLHKHLMKQAKYYGYENTDLIDKIVYSHKWNPSEEYNGCNLVEDHLHPFLPCFIHDYRWVVEGGGNNTDLEFRNNLRIFKFNKLKCNIYYVAVRLGWFFYYKWVKKSKKKF